MKYFISNPTFSKLIALIYHNKIEFFTLRLYKSHKRKMSVTFLNRVRKSYKVEISPGVKFKNERGSHVETELEGLTGQSFPLGRRSEKNIHGNVAVMYEVQGITNCHHHAHLTVYFGPPEDAKDY